MIEFTATMTIRAVALKAKTKDGVTARRIRLTIEREFDDELAASLGPGRVGLRRHHVLPVLPVAVPDEHRDRRAQRLAGTHAGQPFDLIRFDLHARAAAIALLTTRQFVIDPRNINRNTGGQSFDYRDKRATV